MNLYYIYQGENHGYDTYDSAVVAAKNEEDARNTEVGDVYSWTAPIHVKVELICKAVKGIKAGIICSSFNAG